MRRVYGKVLLLCGLILCSVTALQPVIQSRIPPATIRHVALPRVKFRLARVGERRLERRRDAHGQVEGEELRREAPHTLGRL